MVAKLSELISFRCEMSRLLIAGQRYRIQCSLSYCKSSVQQKDGAGLLRVLKCSVIAESTRDYCVLGCKRDGAGIVAPVCSGKNFKNREMRCRREFVKERRALLGYGMFELPFTAFLQEFVKSYFETKEEAVQSVYIYM